MMTSSYLERNVSTVEESWEIKFVSTSVTRPCRRQQMHRTEKKIVDRHFGIYKTLILPAVQDSQRTFVVDSRQEKTKKQRLTESATKPNFIFNV